MNVTRRGFLALFAPAVGSLFFHHRKGHDKGRPKPTTTTTTVPAGSGYRDTYSATY